MNFTKLTRLVSYLSSFLPIQFLFPSFVGLYQPPFQLSSDPPAAMMTAVDTLPGSFVGGPRPQLLMSSLGDWSNKLKIEFPSVAVVAEDQADWQQFKKKTKQVRATHVNDCTALPDKDQGLDDSFYQVMVNGHRVAELPNQRQASLLAKQLRKVLKTPEFNPARLKPGVVGGEAVGKVGKTVLFQVDPDIAAVLERSSDLIAIDWTNNLRVALGADPIPLIEAQTEMYRLTRTNEVLEGTASWYGPYFHNRQTATGERFNQNELTAAHPSLPFDTYLKVTNLDNRESVIVRINDRGPYWGDRSLDLSLQAARCIGSEHPGVVRYEAVIMEPAAAVSQASEKPSKPEKPPFQLARRP